MRSVTFVDRISIDYSGNIAQNALCLGDVDNDGCHELVAGTDQGEMIVVKGDSGRVWKRSSDLGFVMAVGIGDLLNQGRNVVVVVSGCGLLSVFDFHNEGAEEESYIGRNGQPRSFYFAFYIYPCKYT